MTSIASVLRLGVKGALRAFHPYEHLEVKLSKKLSKGLKILWKHRSIPGTELWLFEKTKVDL